MKQKELFLLMFSSVLLSSTFISCEGNGMYGIEEDLYPCSEDMECVKTRAVYTEYLDLPTYEPEIMTKRDFKKRRLKLVVLAAERMGLSFINNHYVFTASCGNEVNISDSLFNYVKEQFEYSNKILNENSSESIIRLKRGNNEWGNGSNNLPNCVPAAISHMGKGTPSYDNVVRRCDYYDSDWRTTGGVDGMFVGPIIREFYSNTETMYSLPKDTTFTPNKCVMMLKRGTKGHTVNVDDIEAYIDGHMISYSDYSSTGKGEDAGVVHNSEMAAIYPFKD